jgi:hypothetical protein
MGGYGYNGRIIMLRTHFSTGRSLINGGGGDRLPTGGRMGKQHYYDTEITKVTYK